MVKMVNIILCLSFHNKKKNTIISYAEDKMAVSFFLSPEKTTKNRDKREAATEHQEKQVSWFRFSQEQIWKGIWLQAA